MIEQIIVCLSCVALLAGGGTIAKAAITDVSFIGHGDVAYNLSGTYLGDPKYQANIALGDGVTVTGALHFGTHVVESGPIAPMPNHFTGITYFDTDALFDGQQSFDFSVRGPVGTDGFSFSSKSPPLGGPYKSGSVSFVNGHLVAFDLSADDDGFSGDLSNNRFDNYRGYEDAASFGGSVVIDRASTSVPEPATWSLMVVGLGATGFTLRRRGGSRVQAIAS